MIEERKETIRVVDRRKFTADGERRPGTPEEEAAPPRAEETPRPTAAEIPAPPAEAPQPAPPGLFEGLVGFLVENAMAAIRAGAGPAVVGQFIDLLEMLQQKTRGNLTDQESRVLTDTLGELKLLFLKFKQAGGPGGRA